MSALVSCFSHFVQPKFTQNQNGDITVDLNGAFAKELDPLDTTCKAKRDDNTVDCLAQGAEDLLQNQPIFDWLNEEAANLDSQLVLRNWVNPDEDQAFSHVMAFVGAQMPRQGIPRNRLLPLAHVVFILKVARYYAERAVLRHFVIEANRRATQDWSPVCLDGEFKPQCDIVFCQGQNGKCTAPEFKGCNCNNDKKCPPADRIPLCVNCGGDGGAGNCKGLADHNNLWQGCQCFAGAHAFGNHPYKDQKSLDDAKNFWKNAGKHPGQPDGEPAGKQCFGLGTPTWVEYPAAIGAANAFASDESLITGNVGDTHEKTFNPGTNDMVKVSAKFEADGLGGHYKITDAGTGLAVVVNGCDADNPQNPNPSNRKHGGRNQYRGTSPLSTVSVEPLAGDAQPSCDPEDPPGLKDQYKVAMRRDGLLASIQDFCKNQAGKDIGQGLDTLYGPFGPPSSPDGFGRQAIHLFVNRPGVQTKECAEWDGKVNEDACVRAFNRITDGCDTDTRIAKRGGRANYVCADYKIEGSGGADMFRMHLHQFMERDRQFLEWTIYDSRGKKVGGPSTGPNPEGAPYKISFWVDSPTDKDATNVRMYYPDSPIQGGFGGLQNKWSTGWTGAGPGSQDYQASFFCDDVLDKNSPGYWKPIGAGFERHFDCYFRGWANADGMAGDVPYS